MNPPNYELFQLVVQALDPMSWLIVHFVPILNLANVKNETKKKLISWNLNKNPLNKSNDETKHVKNGALKEFFFWR